MSHAFLPFQPQPPRHLQLLLDPFEALLQLLHLPLGLDIVRPQIGHELVVLHQFPVHFDFGRVGNADPRMQFLHLLIPLSIPLVLHGHFLPQRLQQSLVSPCRLPLRSYHFCLFHEFLPQYADGHGLPRMLDPARGGQTLDARFAFGELHVGGIDVEAGAGIEGLEFGGGGCQLGLEVGDVGFEEGGAGFVGG